MTAIEIVLGAEPFVLAEVGGHVVMWDVVVEWQCSCGHKATKTYPYCEHVVLVARHLNPAQANRLIQALRAAGHMPSSKAFDADRRMHPGEVVNKTTY